MRWIFAMWMGTVWLIAQQPTQVDESIQVFRKIVEVRVLNAGKPVLNLRPEDFKLELAGQGIPIQTCTWHERAVPEVPEPMVGKVKRLETRVLQKEPGRKLVFFFQGDFSGQRNVGLLKGAFHARELTRGLRDTDWVAVFSYVSHFSMHSDWTSDQRQIRDAINDAFHHTDEFWPSDDPFHCLEDHFDRQYASQIASPEQALGYLGKILNHEKGTKQVFYVGWGLGRFSREGVRMTPDYAPAIAQLARANATVFSLDISQADYHSLEVGMKLVAQQTGGTYERTYPFSGRSFRRVLKAVDGYYLITFEPPANEYDKGLTYRLTLRKRKGIVYARDPRFW